MALHGWQHTRTYPRGGCEMRGKRRKKNTGERKVDEKRERSKIKQHLYNSCLKEETDSTKTITGKRSLSIASEQLTRQPISIFQLNFLNQNVIHTQQYT